MDYVQLARFYPEDYWGQASDPSDDWIHRSQSEKTRFLSECDIQTGRVLDVGCGSGFFLRALNPSRWERFGVETGGQAVSLARKALGQQNIFEGTLLNAQLDASSFDLVTFWSALEHSNEPRDNLVEARRVIRDEGTVIIQVPNADSYQARHFKGDWFALDAPRHRYHFSLETLGTLLEQTGFRPYRFTFRSKTHNSHALKQSLKSRLVLNSRGLLRPALFYLSVRLLKPFDFAMTRLSSGATLTIAARAE